ncbi:MAG: division/cell wall cluster transcriptional repressor MraZ [Bacteroidetes bacterium HGW-Bacteroidetes-15]|nr:MAG: division/cell wall cluster transcriptional repressor MraZ [Bacteroidetes bacterium HGW-Bacteroidetes-15]
MPNIIGTYECNLDSKGRFMFPVAFKKQLAAVMNEGFVLKRSVFCKCLDLYPIDVWETEMSRINKLNRFVRKNNDFIRRFMAGVKHIYLDSVSRLLIPKDLLSFAELKKELVLASAVNRIEIWDKETYEKTVNDKTIEFGDLAEDVMGDVKFEDDELS